MTLRYPSVIGLGAGRISRNTFETIIDDIELAVDIDIEAVRESLLQIDHLDVGPSTVLNVGIAERLATKHNCDVITVSFDHGNRYRPISGAQLYDEHSF